MNRQNPYLKEQDPDLFIAINISLKLTNYKLEIFSEDFLIHCWKPFVKALKTFINPLSQLQQEEEARYREKVKIYEEEYRQWKKSKDTEIDVPVRPKPPLFRELEANGYGKTEGEGNKLTWKANSVDAVYS
ncbi:MAG: hypothetical protein AAF383_10090 [Cyanobacteria bacterium P01_A01_bin.83]